MPDLATRLPDGSWCRSHASRTLELSWWEDRDSRGAEGRVATVIHPVNGTAMQCYSAALCAALVRWVLPLSRKYGT